MGCRPTGQKHHQPCDILWMADALVRRRLRYCFYATLHLHQPARHLARVESWRNRIARDESRAKLNGQVLRKVNGGGLGGRVSVRGIWAKGANAETSHGGGDDDARRVINCPALAEQRLELLYSVEDALDVQVHDL